MIIDKLTLFLEKLDRYRDEVLFLFIKPYWPRFISPNHLTYTRIIIGLLLAVLLFFFNKFALASLKEQILVFLKLNFCFSQDNSLFLV
jgi:phosphatidylglycerophosphate synthase